MSRYGSLKKLVLVLAVFGIVSVGAGTAKADIVVITSVDNTGTNNVLLNTSTDVSVVTGTVGPMNLAVNFTSSGGLLSAPASGQARVEGGTGNNPFSQLTFGLAEPGGVFDKAVFNINAGANGSVTILVQGINITGGSFSQSFTVDANGENFFTISAINGQLITSISLTATGGANFEDVRQVRIGGEHIVPEPTSMFLLGSGLLGVAAGLRKRLRKK